MEMKKKRGSNYTHGERKILLELIRKYNNIIESKETTANMSRKKKEAWESVCQQYNSVAVSGFRTWQQLRHLYENLKQRAKKKIVATKKEMKYAAHAYRTICIERGQIIAKVTPQVMPSQDDEDDGDGDAAVYLCKTEIKNNNSDTEMEVPPVTNHENNIDHEDILSGPKKITDVAGMKEEYFRIKLKNAELEKEYLIDKHKMEMSKYRLQMDILKLKLEKLKSTSRKQNEE